MTTIGINFMANKEIERHNRVMEALGLGELQTKQAQIGINVGTLQEAIRHNIVSEAQNEYANTTGRINAAANAKQAEVAAGRLGLDTYRYETTGRQLDESNIQRNLAAANKDVAQVGLIEKETVTEQNKAQSEVARTELLKTQRKQAAADTMLKATQAGKSAIDAWNTLSSDISRKYDSAVSTIIKGISIFGK